MGTTWVIKLDKVSEADEWTVGQKITEYNVWMTRVLVSIENE